MTRNQQLQSIIDSAALAHDAHDKRASETRGARRSFHRWITRVRAVAIDVAASAMDAPTGASSESDN